ncbi:MAG TPA: ABC transporter permease [Ktedonobacteraceae bacterium]|nr:ABC transporter permease [Ktedonobacteraceae bacterium]
MSTQSPSPQPLWSRDEQNPDRPGQSRVEVDDIAPQVVMPSGEKALADVDAPEASGGALAAPMPGASSFAFATVGGRLADLWNTLTRNRKAAIGLLIVALFVLVAIFGPIALHHDPNALSSDTLQPPSAAHWLGTTQTGQDVFSQVIYGTRASVFWGFLTGVLVTVLSVIVGLTAGYFGGVVDEVLSLLTNVFLVLPGLPLAIVLASFIPVRGPQTVALVLLITSWAWGARVLRAQTLTMRQRDFVEAARSNGENAFRIIFFEILPNEIALVAAGFVGTVTYVILAEAGLEFIGLGNVTTVSWGTMFYWSLNNDALLLGAWWWFVPPGVCIALLGAALALINNGIDEIANPKLRTERKPKALKEAGKAPQERKAVAL